MKANKLLGVFAHPDDESVLAGGILAAAAARGAEVTVLCATRGENGPIADGVVTRETVGDVREAELHAACGATAASSSSVSAWNPVTPFSTSSGTAP